jgi:hypothetical protein
MMYFIRCVFNFYRWKLETAIHINICLKHIDMHLTSVTINTSNGACYVCAFYAVTLSCVQTHTHARTHARRHTPYLHVSIADHINVPIATNNKTGISYSLTPYITLHYMHAPYTRLTLRGNSDIYTYTYARIGSNS